MCRATYWTARRARHPALRLLGIPSSQTRRTGPRGAAPQARQHSPITHWGQDLSWPEESKTRPCPIQLNTLTKTRPTSTLQKQVGEQAPPQGKGDCGNRIVTHTHFTSLSEAKGNFSLPTKKRIMGDHPHSSSWQREEKPLECSLTPTCL